MSYQLRADEVLEALQSTNHPMTEQLVQEVEAAVQRAADAVSEALHIDNGLATFEGLAFAGLCVAFFPSYEGQPIPEIFEDHQFDNREQWGD